VGGRAHAGAPAPAAAPFDEVKLALAQRGAMEHPTPHIGPFASVPLAGSLVLLGLAPSLSYSLPNNIHNQTSPSLTAQPRIVESYGRLAAAGGKQHSLRAQCQPQRARGTVRFVQLGDQILELAGAKRTVRHRSCRKRDQRSQSLTTDSLIARGPGSITGALAIVREARYD
jgi:hypothetical protein